MSYCTADPDADLYALHKDQDAADAADAANHKRLSDALVAALQHGADEPLENITAGEALYEVQCDHVDGTKRVEQLVYWAARQTDNPVLRAMVREVADAFADVRTRT